MLNDHKQLMSSHKRKFPATGLLHCNFKKHFLRQILEYSYFISAKESEEKSGQSAKKYIKRGI